MLNIPLYILCKSIVNLLTFVNKLNFDKLCLLLTSKSIEGLI